MKELKYLWYVLRHKWFVFLECCNLGIPWLGIIHDWSKFRPGEFIPYARYFYGNYPKLNELTPYEKYSISFGLLKEDIERHFDKAWLYHIHRNKHHWQFWLLQEDNGSLKNIPIPVRYLKEIIADWNGAGKAITGKANTIEWYLKHKHIINLNRINRKWIEKKLFEKPLEKPPETHNQST